ncbi:hypothetical protein Tco_0143952 [Tanacetum coccineum]
MVVHSLNLSKKNVRVPEVIAPIEQDNPQTENVEGPPDPLNIEETEEQNDRWSKGQHIKRSMTAKLTAASASECLFVDFLSEIEPKKFLSEETNGSSPDLAGKLISGFDLKGYSDLDYVGCNMDRKSTSVEAEYVAVAGCCANILWMKNQLNDYDIHYMMVPIFCDNTSAIAISNNPVLHSRTKHIDIRYHFIRDHIHKGDIELYFILTEYQLADIFTKPLDEPTFTRLKAELGMLNID